MRLAPYDGRELEDGDEDVGFIARLVEEAETEVIEPAPPQPRPDAAREFVVRADDGLSAFRETRPVRRRPRVLEAMPVGDVEMDDLLEQLATTAAALRRRKAA
jgi:hypothetical protein